jgi:hypothetical protein
MSSVHGQGQSHGHTLSKPRPKVKPILRKLTQSEKNSLDLDRPSAEQDGLGIYDYGSRSSHDVVFAHAGRRGYHNRSTSGTSQFSTATTGNGRRSGSFVHPFQQTPRPYTPPVAASYQNSLRESEHSNSPVVTEDEDQSRFNLRSTSNLSSNHTSSLISAPSPVISHPLLRIQTKQASSSRLALETSQSSLHDYLSPLSPDLISPVDTMTPSPAIRSSFDRGFRSRSRSEADTRNRAEGIQEARRKFEEKEKVKEEKAAKEEVRKMEKRSKKEALMTERTHRRSSTSNRPNTRSRRSKSDLTMQSEKNGPHGQEYSTDPGDNGLEHSANSGYARTSAKKKTHSTWTTFMLWLRTRFLRMKKRTPST